MGFNFKRTHTFFPFLLLASILFAQNYKIDYYGIVSTQIDSNMSKMTSDLYYTQLSEISNFNVTDKRTSTVMTTKPNAQDFSSLALSFYTEISKENSSDHWITTFHVVDAKNSEEHIKTKRYDSFYKILMESKNELKETIRELIESDSNATALVKNSTPQNSSSQNSASQSSQKSTSENPATLSSTESLAGTWSGEENIQKIVILRGGRGFVIFKNGASMNISVELQENNSSNIVITQKGRSNASFYPELPRNLALNAALSAPPIQWVLTASSETSLYGTKVTLIQDGDSYKSGEIKVAWEKID